MPQFSIHLKSTMNMNRRVSEKVEEDRRFWFIMDLNTRRTMQIKTGFFGVVGEKIAEYL